MLLYSSKFSFSVILYKNIILNFALNVWVYQKLQKLFKYLLTHLTSDHKVIVYKHQLVNYKKNNNF